MIFCICRYLKEKVQDADTLSIHPNALGAQQVDDDAEVTPAYKWWHIKLADYFETSENYDRKVEVTRFDNQKTNLSCNKNILRERIKYS